ncbi:P-type DNA transfer protein VirB5 [Yersinia ruckeri]|uniref:P-type DNA transfer protein VirB5 n=1 Tax=Yersinia ruckeri TaxID=29486 RepID=UPI002238C3E8|nr:P-type DNA transfer protein VirB5 [Yersinia ruckeri]MCW6572923.1 P-type DNA transfer protein VirB5 [Yersinia ruckeri]
MKKNLLGIALIMASTFPISTIASGIPTVDVANIAQLAVNAQQQAKEALSQLNTAKDAISQAKAQYDHYKGIVTGNDKLGDFLNDPLLNKVLPVGDWKSIYQDAASLPELRQRYGLTSSNAKVQEAFDQLLSQAAALENSYEASNDRVKNAEQLRSRLNLAETPQQKEDLALRYQQENLELQNQQVRMQNMKMLMDEKAKIENKKRSQDFKDYMLGKRPDIPTYE